MLEALVLRPHGTGATLLCTRTENKHRERRTLSNDRLHREMGSEMDQAAEDDWLPLESGSCNSTRTQRRTARDCTRQGKPESQDRCTGNAALLNKQTATGIRSSCRATRGHGTKPAWTHGAEAPLCCWVLVTAPPHDEQSRTEKRR